MLSRFGPSCLFKYFYQVFRAKAAANHSDSLGRSSKRENKSYANSLSWREVGGRNAWQGRSRKYIISKKIF